MHILCAQLYIYNRCQLCIAHLLLTDKGSLKIRAPHSLEITRLYSSFSVYIKNGAYAPSLPATLPELAGGIRVAAARATPALLTNVWTELEYRYDMTVMCTS